MADARRARSAARDQINTGIDPAQAKRIEKKRTRRPRTPTRLKR
ncbi:hypothetical protein ACFS07_06695 [Undibacterium arcticum]